MVHVVTSFNITLISISIKQVLAAQEEIIRKEKELQKARQQLATIYQHQNRFKERPQDDDSSSSF